MKSRFRVFVFFIFAFAAPLVWSADYYDEMYLVPPSPGKKGVPRPQYRNFLEAFEKLSEAEKKKFLRDSKVFLEGDNAVSPLVKLMTQSEYDLVKRGTEQRALALQKFLKDYYSGKSRWKKVVPEDVMKRIVKRNGAEGIEKFVNPNEIHFPYAVDLVRDAEGNFRPLEDNPGYYGGPGDIQGVREFLKKTFPQGYVAAGLMDDPKEFAREWIAKIREHIGPSGKIVFITQNFITADHEDRRMEKILTDLGVEVLDPYNSKGRPNGSELRVTKSGVYMKRPGETKLSKIDYLIMNLEHTEWDLKPKALKDQAIMKYAEFYRDDEDPAKSKWISKKKKKILSEAMLPDHETGIVDTQKVLETMRILKLPIILDTHPDGDVPGLMEAIKKGLVKTSYSLGVDIVGDKEFYTYVPALIREFLNEEAILKNVETEMLAIKDEHGNWVRNQSLVEELRHNREKYVLKMVDGRGGDGISVGPKVTDSQWQKAIDIAVMSPERYQGQAVINLSRMGNYLTDTRAMGYVGPWEFLMSPTLWARGVPAEGNGKVNLSDKGVEFIVGVVNDPIGENSLKQKKRSRKPCHEIFSSPSP